jgi:hypothetical protein
MSVGGYYFDVWRFILIAYVFGIIPYKNAGAVAKLK